MATESQFTTTPNAGTPKTVTAANTALDGTGTTDLVFTAGASGSFLPALRVAHLGTNTNPSVCRVFKNNGGAPSTAANNALIAEKTIPANTLSQAAASTMYDIPIGVLSGNGGGGGPERIYVTFGTAGSSAGWKVTPIDGGDF